jgi:branched-chain amino acid transport system substrate-binding protein
MKGSKVSKGWISLVIFVVLAAVFSVSCGGKSPSTEISLGALVASSGELEVMGKDTAATLDITVQEINDYLAATGSKRKVRVYIEDTGSNPDTALKKLQALADKKIRLLIGPMSSAEVAAVKNFADSHGLLVLSTYSTATSLEIAGDNIFRLVFCDSAQAGLIAKVFQSDGFKAVVPLYRGDTWGIDMTQAVKAEFTRLGGVLLDGSRYSPDTTDFSSALQSVASRVVQAQAAYGKTAILLLSFEEVVPLFMQAGRIPALGSVKWYGSDGTAATPKLTGSRESAAFAVKTGFLSPTLGIPADAAPTGAKVKKVTGHEPQSTALVAHDALWIAFYASLLGEQTDGSSESLKRVLAQTAGAYTGILGRSSFNSAGDRSYGSFDFWEVRENQGAFEWQVALTYELDSGSGEWKKNSK